MLITSVTIHSSGNMRFGKFDQAQVLFDLAMGALKLGVDIAVATPKGYEIPQRIKEIIQESAKDARVQGKLIETRIPEEAVKDADVLVTDTW